MKRINDRYRLPGALGSTARLLAYPTAQRAKGPNRPPAPKCSAQAPCLSSGNGMNGQAARCHSPHFAGQHKKFLRLAGLDRRLRVIKGSAELNLADRGY